MTLEAQRSTIRDVYERGNVCSGSGPTPAQQESFGSVKARYR
jgi:hypothetical protein